MYKDFTCDELIALEGKYRKDAKKHGKICLAAHSKSCCMIAGEKNGCC